MSAPEGADGDDPALGLRRLIGDDGALLGAPRVTIDLPVARALFRHMRRIRRLDERMIALQRQGRIGFYGACTGQEAAPVAAGLALSESDWVFPALRESAVLLVRGLPLVPYLAQLFGNALDLGKGRQMPSHQASRRFRQVSWSSCIATQLPHAVGAAYAARRLGRSEVMLAFLGDGATSHPDFHAALNFAGVFRAGVVFVCQNNQYAISLPAERQTASATFAVKARAYGVAAERVDGNDPLAVYEALALSLERARAGGGATLIECVTYRIGAHSSSDDPARYRAESEVLAWRARDPIKRLATYLSRAGETEADPLGIEREFELELDQALSEVEAAPPPALGSLFDDVYADLPWPLREQRDELLRVAAAPSESGA
ncbi:MAG TPA: thiamine pyrophosphate-dependent enzyme [Polyangiaceae bacterium]|jgi:pyruvate dehydrogenase E1 component alpha subunit/2-oxoisovalerate dehydrogenase E1 component alpha subunit|nr:thiamine pyrophosphate-dependent enzyme [Polyangiaceae bacterium]